MADPRDDPIQAHQHSSRHYDEVMRSESCGCFYCGEVFPPSEIKEWIQDGDSTAEQTAICPHCGIDSVIGSASSYPVTSDFLQRMRELWF